MGRAATVTEGERQRAGLHRLLEAVALAMLSETFDAHDERMLVWLQQPLDRKGWREAVKAHRDLVRKMDGIYKGSKLRLAEGKNPRSRMLGTYGVFLFESPPRNGEEKSRSE